MKRAKYVGPHDAVEVWPNGYTGPSVVVEHGHLLPAADEAGNQISATFRDSLLEQEDAWTAVNQRARRPKPAQKEG